MAAVAPPPAAHAAVPHCGGGAAAECAAAAPQTPDSLGELAGRWTLDRGASGDVRRAVDTVASHMNFFVRGIARGRLRSAAEAYDRLTVVVTPTQVTVIAAGHPPVVSPVDGTPVPWRRENGERYQVTTRFVGGALVQRFTSDEGWRENVYAPSPDGRTLTVGVTVNGPRLPMPVTYRLVYRRDAPPGA